MSIVLGSLTSLLMWLAYSYFHAGEYAKALEAYEEALGPKRLVTLSGGHFDAYTDDFDASSEPAVKWFCEHLKP